MAKVNAGKIRINCLRKDKMIQRKEKTVVIITVNAQFVYLAQRLERFRTFANKSCTTIDSQIIYYFLKLKHKQLHIEKLAGSDIIYDFLQLASTNNMRIFFLGGSEETNQNAVKNALNMFKNIEVDGYSPMFSGYPFDKETCMTIQHALYRFRPDILFVGFGAPKQEFWIEDNLSFLNDLNVGWVVGCGGTLDFISGKIKRAPKLIRLLCLESIYRIIKEPYLFRLKRLITSFQGLYYLMICRDGSRSIR